MRQILIIGAGRSASSLIQYLLDKSEKLHLIGDLSLAGVKPTIIKTQLQ
jgi:saccharopine dehydrogenase-like NADP-dependent oxidoreductase